MNVTWTPRAGVELEGSDDLARAHDWLEQADAGPDAPLALQLDALAEAATWCRVRPSADWGELSDFVAFEENRPEMFSSARRAKRGWLCGIRNRRWRYARR